jgi:hypothetical protein
LASDFKKILVKDVLFQYPRMDQTYQWDSVENRSVPCAQGAQNAVWSIGFMVSAEQAKEITDQCKQHYNECKARNPKLGKLSKVFGMKKNDDGTVTFSAKRNAIKKKTGEPNKEPVIIDGNKQPLADRRFWSGSTGSLSILISPQHDPDKNLGISMLVGTVQVVNAIYGDAGDDFDVVAGSVTRNEASTDNDDPFGLPNQSTPSAPAQTLDYDLDDEIPF